MKWSKLAKFLEYKKNKSVFSLISFQAIMYFLNVDLPIMVNFEAFSVSVIKKLNAKMQFYYLL